MESVEKNDNMELKRKDDQSAVKDMFVDFASSTTAHGISRFATAPAWTAKVSWFLIWLGVMAGFIYMVAELIVLFNSKPVSTSVSVAYEKQLTFPGVTICNLNILQRSQSQDIVSSISKPASNQDQIGNMYKNIFANKSSQGLDTSAIVTDEVMAAGDEILKKINKLSVRNRINKGYQFDGFIIYCSWSTLRCDKGYFRQHYWTRSWNWKYGNCYTFNGFTSSNGTSIEPLKSSSGSPSSLQITIDIKQKEYLQFMTVEKGIRFLIAEQDIALLPVEEGFTISPGVSASISLRKQSIIRSDVYNNGSCMEASRRDGQKYTLQNCQKMCHKKKQMEMCNCTLVEFSASGGSNCLSIAQDRCVFDVETNFTKNVYDCSATCPNACSDVIFHQTITQGKIYAPGYLTMYGVKNKTEDYVDNNIIQLSVYYGSTSVETIQTTTYYEFGNLISDIGGQLGLWIGVSAVTCVEFLVLIWNLIIFLIYRKKKTRVNTQL